MALSPAALAMMMQGKVKPKALLSQMVAEMADDDPQMAMVSQYLAMQPDDDSDDESADEEIREGANPSRQWVDDQELMSLREEVATIQANLEEQTQLLQELIDRNTELAAALGACPECWGENQSCSACHGRGVPGALKPDKKCFDYYIAPLLARLKSMSKHRGQPPQAGSPS